MPSNEPTDESITNLRQKLVAIVAVAGLLVLAVYLYNVFNRPPQMGASEEAFTTVDALFTAVTARDENKLNDCEKRLKRLEESGQLPTSAWKSLDSLIRKAHAGNWQSAAESLYAFMLAQRREGSPGHEKSPGRSVNPPATRKK